MRSKTNLAFARYNSYNDDNDETDLQKILIPRFTSNTFLSLTKKTLIMRQNILASGMEPSDIDKAFELTQTNTRR